MATSILDSRDEIKKLDLENVLGSIEMLPEQIQDAWNATKNIVVPDTYKHITSIVVSGMGGSELGSRIIHTLYQNDLKVPFEIVNGYHLPGYVDEHTLVLLSSYSGTTEETLSCAAEALEKHALVAVITSGGDLEKFAGEHNFPAYIIKPKYNPSNQPRMAIGYSVFGQLGLFNAVGVISVTDEQVQSVVTLLQKNAKGLCPESTEQNAAKFLAYSSVDKMLTLVSSEHLEGAVRVFNNQLNENAKAMTSMLYIPDLNHHSMEGLGFPKHMQSEVLFLFFVSQLYTPKVMKRYPITSEVVEKQGIQYETVYALGKTKLEQVFEVVQLGGFVNFYLAMLYGINPAPIPWVNYFKEQLSK